MPVVTCSPCSEESGCICRACRTRRPRSRPLMIFGSAMALLQRSAKRNIAFHKAECTPILVEAAVPLPESGGTLGSCNREALGFDPTKETFYDQAGIPPSQPVHRGFPRTGRVQS